MPTYCFMTKHGDIVERTFDRNHIPEYVLVGNERAWRCRYAEGVTGAVAKAGGPVNRGSARWPMEPCYASGVNASQAQELRDFFKHRGVPTDVTDDGDPIYESAAHRRKALKVRGLHDESSFD